MPSVTLFRDREDRHQHEVLVHHADAGRDRVARRAELRRLPSIRISPSSGWVSPYRTFISVVFPAPFSPSRAWTWPGATDRLIPSFAASRPYLLVMPLSSSSTYVRPRLNRALGRRLDAPVLDSGLDRLQLGLQRAGTWPEKSWNGDSTAPPLASVPM